MTLEDLFNKYPKIFNKNYEYKINWYSIPDTWIELVDNLCETIQQYIDHNDVQQVECTTLKEKFGSLRFYYTGGDDYVSGMVWFAENLSTKLCIECKSTKNVQPTKGWISYLCEDCYNKKQK